MPRPRVHARPADRQRAYRARLASRLPGASPPARPTVRSQPSRPTRLAALEQGLRGLVGVYQAWLDALPCSLQRGTGRRSSDSMQQQACLGRSSHLAGSGEMSRLLWPRQEAHPEDTR